MYELKETPIMDQSIIDTSNYVTRVEFEELVNRLKNFLNAPTSETREPAAANVPVKTEPEV